MTLAASYFCISESYELQKKKKVFPLQHFIIAKLMLLYGTRRIILLPCGWHAYTHTHTHRCARVPTFLPKFCQSLFLKFSIWNWCTVIFRRTNSCICTYTFITYRNKTNESLRYDGELYRRVTDVASRQRQRCLTSYPTSRLRAHYKFSHHYLCL